MTVRRIYIAEDGKEFDNEWECADYEGQIRANEFKDIALLFDEAGKPLPLTERGFENAFFILCKTDAAAQYLYDEYNDSYGNPWWGGNHYSITAGFWYYNGDTWVAVDEVIKVVEIAKTILEG